MSLALRAASGWLVAWSPLPMAVFCILSLVGLGVASYLTWVHWSGVPAACGVGGGCQTVNRSGYADIQGAPVALLGALLYGAILATGIWRLAGWRRGEWMGLAALGLTLFGAAYSAYLTYVEVAVLRAVCNWCLASASAMAGLAIIAVAQVLLPGATTRTEPRQTA